MTRSKPSAAHPDSATSQMIVDAAREVIAQRGLAGMSLRVVAEAAGLSVGTISYRIGDRAALVQAVVRREAELAAASRELWRARAGRIDVIAAGLLPDLVAAWLDEAAAMGRVSAICRCELVVAANRPSEARPEIGGIFDEIEGLWRDLLGEAPETVPLAAAITDYCADELPFTILLAGEPDYRLLRQSTLRALIDLFLGARLPDRGTWHMTLVDRLGDLSAIARSVDGMIPQGMKAAIAERSADLILESGVDSLSHRTIAQASNAPVSTVAHHFPTVRDLVRGGVEALIHRMQSEIRSTTDGSVPSGLAVIRMGHELALAALRLAELTPFAIDMRRRRAENVHQMIAGLLGNQGADRATSQAVVMMLIGSGFRSMPTDTRASLPEAVTSLAMAVRSFQEIRIIRDM